MEPGTRRGRQTPPHSPTPHCSSGNPLLAPSTGELPLPPPSQKRKRRIAQFTSFSKTPSGEARAGSLVLISIHLRILLDLPWLERPGQGSFCQTGSWKEQSRKKSTSLPWSPAFWALASLMSKWALTLATVFLVQSFQRSWLFPRAFPNNLQQSLKGKESQRTSLSLWRPPDCYCPGWGWVVFQGIKR